MTVADFSSGRATAAARKLQLVDGEVRAMSPGSVTHGTMQSKLGYDFIGHGRDAAAGAGS